MHNYLLLCIVVLMLRNPKTGKKLQYGQTFPKQSHFWRERGGLGMGRVVNFFYLIISKLYVQSECPL